MKEKIYAILVEDAYSDLALGFPYEVEKTLYAYVFLKNTTHPQRRYDASCFKYKTESGTPITFKELRRLDQLRKVFDGFNKRNKG